MNVEETIASINQLVRSEEPDYLQYLIRCCDNVVKTYPDNPKYGFSPPVLQLLKIKAEARQRLEEIFGIRYSEVNKK